MNWLPRSGSTWPIADGANTSTAGGSLVWRARPAGVAVGSGGSVGALGGLVGLVSGGGVTRGDDGGGGDAHASRSAVPTTARAMWNARRAAIKDLIAYTPR